MKIKIYLDWIFFIEIYFCNRFINLYLLKNRLKKYMKNSNAFNDYSEEDIDYLLENNLEIEIIKL